MVHWFDLGVAGFRVDMASSLVKDDPGHVETGRLWHETRAWLDDAYPGRVLISEWGNPRVAVPAGFHVDFFLQFGGDDDGLPFRSLWNNGAGTVNPSWGEVPAWAGADGTGDARTFVDAWRAAADAIAATGRGGMVGPGSPATSTYLPQDPDPARPTVAGQVDDAESLLHLVRDLIALRHDDDRLDAAESVEVLTTAYPLAYLRGGTLAVVLNPGRAAVSLPLDGAAGARPLVARGLRLEAGDDGGVVHLDGHGYAVLDLVHVGHERTERALPRKSP